MPLFVFVGGFLGAGKTTLILSAAELLRRRGQRVAIITNDQDSELVDTRYAQANAVAAREVAGGCFCCRFSDLMNASEALKTYDPDVIFAEPVGSCVDLSATILQPLKTSYRGEYRIAPLTVLVDPALARRAAAKELDADIDFLFWNQLYEADVVCTTKADLYPAAAELPVPVDFAVSTITGTGVGAWLAEILSGGRVAGARLLQVDYHRYAQAEAALGWLNLNAVVQSIDPVSPASLCGPLLDRLQEQLLERSIFVAHLKIFDQCASGWLKVSVTADSAPHPHGDLLADPELDHELALNLRALCDPEELSRIVTAALGDVPARIQIRHLRAFRPPPPKPEHRFREVVDSV